MARWTWCCAAIVMIAACGGDDGGSDAATIDAATPADATPPSVFTVFEPPAPGAGADWGAMPYPSDLYLDAGGFNALQTLPVGASPNEEYVQFFLERIHELRGAGVKSNVYFPITGDVEPATLTGNVKLVDLDGGLAEVPVDLVWRGDIDCIVAAPKIGVVLREDRRYAAYVTNGVTDTDGVGIGRAPAFDEAVSGSSSDPAIAAARDNLQPLLDALGAETAATVVIATVFTTANVTGEMKALRDAAAATPPAVSAIQVRTDLDAVFGAQDPAAPPGYSRVTVYRNQPHGNVAAVVHGTVGLTNYTSADPDASGIIEFDGSGAPIAKSVEDVRFTLVLPVAASYDQLPVLLHYATFGGSRSEILYTADITAAHGIATMAIDAPHHGDRLASAVDAKNEITGVVGADGFADPDVSATVIRFLQFQASGGYRALDTRVPPDNDRQAAADVCAIVAFVRGGDADPINAALGAAGLPSDLAFDPRGPGLSADSVGALFMSIVAAVEPNADVVLLDVPPGGIIFPTFIHSPQFFGFNAIWYDLFDVRNRIVLEEDSPNTARYDPITMLWGDLLQKGDPLSYAHAIATGELRGDGGAHLVINEVYDDEWIHNQATEWLVGAIGLPRMAISLADPAPEPGLRFADLDDVAAPVSGNLPGGRTGALLLWHPAVHTFMISYEAYQEYEPAFPPFVERGTPLLIDGFTVAAQTMRAQYFADYFAGETPIVRDPF